MVFFQISKKYWCQDCFWLKKSSNKQLSVKSVVCIHYDAFVPHRSPKCWQPDHNCRVLYWILYDKQKGTLCTEGLVSYYHKWILWNMKCVVTEFEKTLPLSIHCMSKWYNNCYITKITFYWEKKIYTDDWSQNYMNKLTFL